MLHAHFKLPPNYPQEEGAVYPEDADAGGEKKRLSNEEMQRLDGLEDHPLGPPRSAARSEPEPPAAEVDSSVGAKEEVVPMDPWAEEDARLSGGDGRGVRSVEENVVPPSAEKKGRVSVASDASEDIFADNGTRMVHVLLKNP